MPSSRNQGFLDAAAMVLGGGNRSWSEIREFVDRYGPLHAFPMYQYAAPAGSQARSVWETTWETYNRLLGWESERARLYAELQGLSPEDADYSRLAQEYQQADRYCMAARDALESAHGQGSHRIVEGLNQEVHAEETRRMQLEEVRPGPQMTTGMADFYNGNPNVQAYPDDLQVAGWDTAPQQGPSGSGQAAPSHAKNSRRSRRH